MLDLEATKLVGTLLCTVVILLSAFVNAENLDVSAYIGCSGVEGFVQRK